MISQSFFKVYNASAGSGKTFTLVKEYLKIVLTAEKDFEFQKILAITFTNKAASEMKQRVLETLKKASKGEEHPIAVALKGEINLSDLQFRDKATKVLSNILYNYASFNIITIDSFTHKLIRTFSMDLGLPLDFEVEMDAEPLLRETIDLLVSKIGEDKALTKLLVSYTLNQVNDDKSWNINESLIAIARLLLNEENEVEVSKLVDTELSDFQKLEQKLKRYLSDTEEAFKQVGAQALALIDDNGIEHKSFSYSDLPNYFKKLLGSTLKDEKQPLGARLAKNMEASVLYASSKPQGVKASIDNIKEDLFALFAISQELCKKHLGQYSLAKKILKTLVPLAVLNHIHKEFANLKEDNNFRLNAEFNRFISNQIKDQPVPFIYERLGEKFEYFFIDEMQDTSELQWQNLIPLIHNTLAQNKGGLMLVGDAKQSIYRWRGGKASQFISLSHQESENSFFIQKQIETLGTNFRSYSNVINFNNDFFSFISEYLKQTTYQEIYKKEKHQKTNSKEGGYVRLEVFEREEDFVEKEFYAKKVYHQILEIEKKGFYRGDICVLTRKKANGIAVANYLAEQGVEVISPDSLLLKNNVLIQFFIRMLRWIENKDDHESFIGVLHYLWLNFEIQTPKHTFFEACIQAKTTAELFAFWKIDFEVSTFFSQSLYDGTEYVIRAFFLESKIDVFGQAFLDLILQFQLKESGGLQSFLKYWDQNKEKLNIEVSPSTNAVQIMTIHKSKGLEFPVVIFPFDLDTEYIQNEKIWYNTQSNPVFCGFESFQIDVSSKLSLYGKQGETSLKKVNQEIQLDNFNLLYVALTRAEEQLYILCDTKVTKSNSFQNYSDYFKAYIDKAGGEYVYEIGNPERISIPKKEEQSFLLQSFVSVDKKENQIYVVQNQESDDQDARMFGTLIHKAFEKITSYQDIDSAWNYIDQLGLSTKISSRAKGLLKNVIEHPLLTDYYKKGLEVYNEYSFVTYNGDVKIMDRLVFDNKDVVVIDYKTGVFQKSHQLQIENYVNILSNIGYVVKAKILVYCNETIEVVID